MLKSVQKLVQSMSGNAMFISPNKVDEIIE